MGGRLGHEKMIGTNSKGEASFDDNAKAITSRWVVPVRDYSQHFETGFMHWGIKTGRGWSSRMIERVTE